MVTVRLTCHVFNILDILKTYFVPLIISCIEQEKGVMNSTQNLLKHLNQFTKFETVTISISQNIYIKSDMNIFSMPWIFP